VIEQFAPQFAGDDQHDAQEFLSFLLDAIHEDLNRSNRRTRSPDPEDPKIPVIVLFQIFSFFFSFFFPFNNQI